LTIYHLRLFLVAVLGPVADTTVARKDKLIARLQSNPTDFTWGEACTLMGQCGFELKKGSGSARAFVHSITKQKVRLHEPHPKPTLLRYMVKELIGALKDAGEIT
jgi:hypothetical protein